MRYNVNDKKQKATAEELDEFYEELRQIFLQSTYSTFTTTDNNTKNSIDIVEFKDDLEIYFKKIQGMSQYLKDIVIGYLRRLTENNSIPNLIIFLCLAFYAPTDKFKYADYLVLDDAQKVVSSYSYAWYTVYGHKLINTDIASVYEWQLKIIKHIKTVTVRCGYSNML